ncbi:hypothetical protein MASR1M46_19210 [Bacteroidales bacterium]
MSFGVNLFQDGTLTKPVAANRSITGIYSKDAETFSASFEYMPNNKLFKKFQKISFNRQQGLSMFQ